MSGRSVLGFFLILLGALFLLDQTGLADFGDLIADWWPVALIGVGLVQGGREPHRRLLPVILIGAGLLFLLDNLGILGVSAWSALWPLLIVGAGVWLIFHRGSAAPASNDADTVNLTATFGGVETASRSTSFRGGSMNAFFGGVGLDLRQARLAPGGALLDVTTFCGGAEITVPRGWRVAIEGTPLFGGFENAVSGAAELPENAPELTVRGTILFGGIEIQEKG